jgi:hypothetical protein
MLPLFMACFTSVFRRAADRQSASRQLSRRDQAKFVALQAEPTTASIASSTCTPSRCGRIPEGAAEPTARSRRPSSPAGIDPKKHIVFNQSQVAEHAELAWVFNCVARSAGSTA